MFMREPSASREKPSACVEKPSASMEKTSASIDKPSTSMQKTTNLEFCQYRNGTKKGHYESYFLRANHPDKAQAFWIRYTIFSPSGTSDKTIGEIWAMYFDGEADKVLAVQEEFPFQQCHFPNDEFSFSVGRNTLSKGKLKGSAQLNGHQISWNLDYQGGQRPILLFKDKMYRTSLPKAKTLVTMPNVLFDGVFNVDGRAINVQQWQGSENHNWGSKHTDEYAWGQVAGFDKQANTFLECSTARIKLGPVWSPWMTLAVLVIEGKRYAFNTICQSIKAKAQYNYFDWCFETSNDDYQLEVKISARKEHFAGLSYKNPPKGEHTCLNSKIASCQLTLTDRHGKVTRLATENRAAFEILTDAQDHGITIHNDASAMAVC